MEDASLRRLDGRDAALDGADRGPDHGRADPVPQAPADAYVAAAPAGFPVEKAAAVAVVALIWLGLFLAVAGVRLPSPSLHRRRGRGAFSAA